MGNVKNTMYIVIYTQQECRTFRLYVMGIYLIVTAEHTNEVYLHPPND